MTRPASPTVTQLVSDHRIDNRVVAPARSRATRGRPWLAVIACIAVLAGVAGGVVAGGTSGSDIRPSGKAAPVVAR